MAGDPVLLEQLLDPVDEELRRREVVLHLQPAGGEQAFGKAFAGFGLCELNERGGARLPAGVLAHPHQRRRPPRRSDLIVEQAAHAAEDEPGQGVVGHDQPLVQLRAFDVPLRRIDQDRQVLRHQRIRFARLAPLQLGQRVLRRLPQPLAVAGREVRDLVVDAGDAEPRRQLGDEAGLYVEQQLRVLVAALDPGSCGRRRRGGRGMGTGEEGEGENGSFEHKVSVIDRDSWQVLGTQVLFWFLFLFELVFQL